MPTEPTTTEATAGTHPVAPPTPRRRQLATAVFVLFCLYVAAMFVLALDQNFHWGLFPNRAEREITAKVQQLGDTSLSQKERDAVTQDIINWNSFSVPPLLKAIESGPPALRDPALKCLQTLALKYYNVDISKYGSDPVKLKQWWAGLQADWAKAEAGTEKK